MFYTPAEEEDEEVEKVSRRERRDYIFIFQKCRLRCQLFQNGEPSINIGEEYLPPRPGSQQQIGRWEGVSAPNMTECLLASLLWKDH